MAAPFNPGDVFRAPYPFIRNTHQYLGDEGSFDQEVWRPGAEFESDGSGDVNALADGVGEVIYTVVSIYTPPKFPTRVFYTRSWVDPNGNTFGKRGLQIAVMSKFKRLARGYLYAFGLRAATGEE